MVQKHILDAIVATMEQRNVSQGELASGLGCSQTTVSRLLRGHTQLTVDDLFKIAKVLKVNPTVFIEQAVAKVPHVVTIPSEVQKIFCSDAVGFQIFNRLKTPTSFSDLVLFFGPEHIPNVRKKISELKSSDAVVEDIDGKLRLNYPDAESIHLSQDAEYKTRITELYGRLRETKGDLTKLTEKESEAWRRINADVVVMDYFTRPQVEEQKSLLLQFVNFVRSQLRANRMNDRVEATELRVIYLSSLPYPDLKTNVRSR
jgi:transcriptional regulator with XRE-family HTH domain